MKNPKLIVKPFAKNGQKNVIPENYETSMESNQATWDQGFGQITMLPVAAGGLPPKGQDFNGIFNQISENIVYLSQGGRFKFSAEYAEAIGGYPKGAILQSDDEKKEYLSLIDNNKVDFNTAPDISASWKLVNTDDLLAQIAGKQPKGDYATKQDMGTKVDKSSVVQSSGESVTNVMSQDASTKTFAPLSLYGKDSDGSAKVGSPSGAVLTFSYNGYLGTTNKDGVQVVSFTNNGTMEKGSIPVGRLTGLTDSPGQSKTAVMSQYGVTQYAADASVFKTESDRSAKIVTPSGRVFSVSYNAYTGVSDADGNPVWQFDDKGRLAYGVIPTARVSGLQQIGVGQKWYSRQDRQQGTTYTNDRDMPIAVAVYGIGCNLYVNEVNMAGAYYQTRSTVFAIVPPRATYRCDRQSGVSENYLTWAEMY